MLTKRLFLALIALVVLAAPTVAQENGTLDEFGLHFQDWFFQGPLNMQDIQMQASAEGKGVIVLFEQRGCQYCALLHAENFTRVEVTDFMKKYFITVQLNMFGEKPVVDFDGSVLTEDQLTDRWGVQYSPTTLVFASQSAPMTSREDAESFRLPGYLKPFYYLAAFDYLISGKWETERFQAYVDDRVAKAIQAGIDPELW